MMAEGTSGRRGWSRVLVGLGSNLGDRRGHLEKAVRACAEHPGVVWKRLSAWRETEPLGGPPQGRFLNGAGEMETALAPADLLAVLKGVETRLGRVRTARHGPRTIDLDILVYGDLVLEEADLIIPHPRICERGFVLEPLAEVAPGWLHPLTGKSFREHWLEFSRGLGRGNCAGKDEG